MIQSATGIILRVRVLTETSLIVHWLTPEFGRIATVAKGARRAKSPFRGGLDLFYVARFSFSRSRRSDLHTLREVSLDATNAALRGDLPRLRQAAYATRLIEQSTETETQLPAISTLMRDLLEHLGRGPAQPQTLFAFELRLLDELGLKPDFAKARLTPGAKQIIHALMAGDWPVVSRLNLSKAQRVEIQQFLHGFLIFHLDRIPPGRAAALRC